MLSVEKIDQGSSSSSMFDAKHWLAMIDDMQFCGTREHRPNGLIVGVSFLRKK